MGHAKQAEITGPESFKVNNAKDVFEVLGNRGLSAIQKQGKEALKRESRPAPLAVRSNVRFEDRLTSFARSLSRGLQAGSTFAARGQSGLAGLASFAGALGGPSPQDVARKRRSAEIEAQQAQLFLEPIESVAPKLVEKFPELRGIPVGIVNRIIPILREHDRSEAFINRMTIKIIEEQKKKDVKFGRDKELLEQRGEQSLEQIRERQKGKKGRRETVGDFNLGREEKAKVRVRRKSDGELSGLITPQQAEKLIKTGRFEEVQ